MIADSGVSDLIATIVRSVLEIYIFTPRRRGKLRDSLSRAERIERIYDWREAGGRQMSVCPRMQL